MVLDGFRAVRSKLHSLVVLLCGIAQTHCGNLLALDISNCKFSSDFMMLHIEELQRGCPRLEVFRLAGCMVRASPASKKAQVRFVGFQKITH